MKNLKQDRVRLLPWLLTGLLLFAIFLGMTPALVLAPTANATANAKGATDTTGDLLADVQSDDAAGASPSSVVSGDGWYTVDKTCVMFIDNFNTSALSGTVTAATLNVQYSVEAGYTGTNPVKWALHGGVLASTGITPADGQVNQAGSYNLYAQGVDTLAEISTLDIEFTNNDGGSPNAVSFDYVWVDVTTRSHNNPPTLTSGSVSPSGVTARTFTYEVTYTDNDNDAPSYVKVYIDGTGYSMTEISGTYTGGALYRYTTTLSAGSHTYYFEASDGFDTARNPSSGTHSGPTVTGPTLAYILIAAPMAAILLGALGFSLVRRPSNTRLLAQALLSALGIAGILSVAVASIIGAWALDLPDARVVAMIFAMVATLPHAAVKAAPRISRWRTRRKERAELMKKEAERAAEIRKREIKRVVGIVRPQLKTKKKVSITELASRLKKEPAEVRDLLETARDKGYLGDAKIRGWILTKEAEVEKGLAEKPAAREMELSDIDEAVLEYIERHRGEIFPSKAALELGVSKGEVEASMRRLRRAGRIAEE